MYLLKCQKIKDVAAAAAVDAVAEEEETIVAEAEIEAEEAKEAVIEVVIEGEAKIAEVKEIEVKVRVILAAGVKMVLKNAEADLEMISQSFQGNDVEVVINQSLKEREESAAEEFNFYFALNETL